MICGKPRHLWPTPATRDAYYRAFNPQMFAMANPNEKMLSNLKVLDVNRMTFHEKNINWGRYAETMYAVINYIFWFCIGLIPTLVLYLQQNYGLWQVHQQLL